MWMKKLVTNHPKDAHISDSAAGGKGESMARESRLLEIDGYFVEGDTKWFRLSNSNLLDTGATDAEIAFYSECSRLASRVEELELVIRELDAAIGVCFDEQDFGSTARGRVILARQQVASVLAGAHAEEKE